MRDGSRRGTGLTMDTVSGPHGGQRLVTAGAPVAAAKAAVVGLHGRGATADGFLRICEEFYRHGVAFLLPAAYHNTWYPNAFDVPRGRNEPHLSSAVEAVGFAMNRAADAGIPPDRTVLVGFSQGGCLAAEYAVRNPRRYGGVGVLSGAIPGADLGERTVEGDFDDTPVLLGCDEADPHVPIERVNASAKVFRGLGAVVDERRYEDAGHAVTDDELETIGSWLDDIL